MRGLLMIVAIFFGFTLCENPVLDAVKTEMIDTVTKRGEENKNIIAAATDKAVKALDKEVAEEPKGEEQKGEEGAAQTAEGG